MNIEDYGIHTICREDYMTRAPEYKIYYHGSYVGWLVGMGSGKYKLILHAGLPTTRLDKHPTNEEIKELLLKSSAI